MCHSAVSLHRVSIHSGTVACTLRKSPGLFGWHRPMPRHPPRRVCNVCVWVSGALPLK